ncbi:N-acetylhexosaminidase [Dacryopinax primogenitus]|uniref:Beta-hexosaminidase n=1 Tax=Dacryopinax primogenitus (strain DJM 731) TaxID=1858805 RepID=M5GAG6_DACPD|nr:N-acetylhexosaminidase [Dacryopinax primogenitus]EJU02942.1 N-acetylhexosaminidase [Dacryopinax primogenitus]
MFLLLFLVPAALALWPNPHSVSYGTSALILSPTFWIHWASTTPAPGDVTAAISRTMAELYTDNLQRLVVGRANADLPALAYANSLPMIHLEIIGNSPIKSIMAEATCILGERDESYTLTIPADGTPGMLQANTTLGLFRGLTTFSQLWYSSGGVAAIFPYNSFFPGSSMIYTVQAPVMITDTPAYPYRGLLLDTARNFFPVADLYRTLDAASYVKINTFHWHITDSQSFPLTVAAFPELSQYGAYSAVQTYSLQDVQDIINYAGARGIDVMLEIDTPGHTASIWESHPEYVACYNEAPWTTYANEPPAGQLRFAVPEVLNFTQQMFASVLSTLPSTLFSTGGDELNTACYVNDTIFQDALTASGQNFSQALNTFVLGTHDTVRAAGKTPAVWEEMLLVQNVSLGLDTLVIVWISSEDALAIAEKGYKMIHGPSDYFYLDCGGGAWLGNDTNGNSWCDPFKTWQKAYSFDPLQNLTASQYSLVLGGQQLLWTEQSGPENVDPIIWPRAAASAEVFWTGANGPDGLPRNSSEALERLHDVRYRMVARGINAINLQPEWCALRPGECNLV